MCTQNASNVNWFDRGFHWVLPANRPQSKWIHRSLSAEIGKHPSFLGTLKIYQVNLQAITTSRITTFIFGAWNWKHCKFKNYFPLCFIVSVRSTSVIYTWIVNSCCNFSIMINKQLSKRREFPVSRTSSYSFVYIYVYVTLYLPILCTFKWVITSLAESHQR